MDYSLGHTEPGNLLRAFSTLTIFSLCQHHLRLMFLSLAAAPGISQDAFLVDTQVTSVNPKPCGMDN